MSLVKVLRHRVLSCWDVEAAVTWLSSRGAKVEAIGQSAEGRPIWAVTLGSGSVKVLSICRLHGNEPASTNGALLFAYHALVNGFYMGIPLRNSLEKVTVHLIPLANPDGAEAYYREFRRRSEPSWKNAFSETRLNSRGADLNRDWLFLRECETRFLHEYVNRVQPHIILDQHEFYFKGGYPPRWPCGKDEFMVTLTDSPYFWVSPQVSSVSEELMEAVASAISDRWTHWPLVKRWFMGGAKPGEKPVAAPIYLGSHVPYEGIAKLLVETWGVGLGEYLMWDRSGIHALAIARTVQWAAERGEDIIRLLGEAAEEELRGERCAFRISGSDLKKAADVLRLHGVTYREEGDSLVVELPQRRAKMARILLDPHCPLNSKLAERGVKYTLDAGFNVKIVKIRC